MICWVVGASGNIGRQLCKRLSDEGKSVFGIGRSAFSAHFDQTWVQWDAAHEPECHADLPAPDVVFFLAGQTSAIVAREDPALDIQANLVSLARVVTKAAKGGSRPLVVSAGSVTEASLDTGGLSLEHATWSLASLYETGKASQRLYLAQFARDQLIDFTTLRLANVYGGAHGFSPDRGFLDRCILMASEGKPLTYFDGGHYLRDYVFIDDVVSAFIRAADYREVVCNQVFDIGTGQAIPIREVLQKLARITLRKTGQHIDVIAKNAPASLHPVDACDRIVDSSRYTRATGWQAEVELDLGLQRSLDMLLSR